MNKKEIDRREDHINNKADIDMDVTTPPGLTIDEIRYRRALLALKKDFCKEKMLRHKDRLLRTANEKDSKPVKILGFTPKSGTFLAKIAGGLNVFDYLMIGISAFKTTKRLIRVFKR